MTACGRVLRRGAAGVIVSEFVLPAGFESREHAHALDGLALPLTSAGFSLAAEGSLRMAPGEIVTLPAGAWHRERAHTAAGCLLIEAETDLARGMPALFDRVAPLRTPDTTASAWRLLAALREEGTEPWEIECEAMELLLAAEQARVGSRTERGRPGWIPRVIERLRDESRDPPSLAALAAGVGVSREHLARKFRQATGQSVGGFIHRLRVLRAAQLLRRPGWSIAQTAIAVGFADQSHLTRVFARLLRTTPHRYQRHHRRLSGSYPAHAPAD